MLNEKNHTYLQEQQKTRPEIEEAINELLNGNKLQNALEFIAYLRANKLTPRWTATNAWWVNYKGKHLFSIRIGRKESGTCSYGLESGSWHIGHWLQGFNFPDDLSDELKKFIWVNVQPCKHCMCCAPGHSVDIFGTKFDSVCYFRIENPDVNGLEFVKMLMQCKKEAITANV